MGRLGRLWRLSLPLQLWLLMASGSGRCSAEAASDGFSGSEEGPQEPQGPPSSEGAPQERESFLGPPPAEAQGMLVSAIAQLNELMGLLEKERQRRKKYEDTVESTEELLTDRKKVCRPNSCRHSGHGGRKSPAQQLNAKTMILLDGFTETAAAMLLGRRPTDEDVRLFCWLQTTLSFPNP